MPRRLLPEHQCLDHGRNAFKREKGGGSWRRQRKKKTRVHRSLLHVCGCLAHTCMTAFHEGERTMAHGRSVECPKYSFTLLLKLRKRASWALHAALLRLMGRHAVVVRAWLLATGVGARETGVYCVTAIKHAIIVDRCFHHRVGRFAAYNHV